MINKEILGILKDKLRLSTSALYCAINRKKEQIGYTYSKEIAAYVLAAENRIDISKYNISSLELAEVREAMKSKEIKALNSTNQTKRKVKKQVILSFDQDFKINCPYIPDSVLNDAKRMQKVYPYLYIFENSIRLFIKTILQDKYGEKWWNTKVSPNIQREVERIQRREGGNRWHGRRGEHPIFYTSIAHLRKIITANFEDFVDKLPDVKRPIEWLTNRIEEIELSRNIVAHNNPLTEDDIMRVKMYFKEWIKQIS